MTFWAIAVLLVMTRVANVKTKQLSCSIRRTFIATEGKLEQTFACEFSEEATKEMMVEEEI